MNYLEGLNEKQLKAVSETEGYVRVIAGAGSGKTKLLVCRYAYLVKECGIDASNIVRHLHQQSRRRDETAELEENAPIDPALLERLNSADNLWKRDDVPHDGWVCTGVTDLGSPSGNCEMCGYQIIRYAHHMVHPHYRPLTAGCVCAGRMEGDVEAARKRERVEICH